MLYPLSYEGGMVSEDSDERLVAQCRRWRIRHVERIGHEYDRLFMADPLVIVADLLAPAFAAVARRRGGRSGGAAQRSRRRPGQRRARARQAARAQPREVAEDVVAARPVLAGEATRRGRRARVHQPHVRRTVPHRAAALAGRRRSPRCAPAPVAERVVVDYSAPTSPRRCTSATCARRSSATRWCGCSTSSATR